MKQSLFIFLALILLLPSSGCFKSRAEIAREKEEKEVQSNIQQNIAEYREANEKLQSELGRLQGRLEELEHQRKKEMSTLYSSKEGTEKNVGDIKSRMEEMQKGQAALFDEIKRLKEENIQLLKAAAEKARAPVQNKKAITFESSLSSYKSKDYDSAIEGFRSYIGAHPKGKKIMDAHFLLGDSLFRKKQYGEAIVEFSVPQERAGKTPIGRKSALKIAESFKAMGRDKDAKAFAQILQEIAPGSEEAKAARKFLK